MAGYWSTRAAEHRSSAQKFRDEAAASRDADEQDELKRSAVDADLLAEACDRNAKMYDNAATDPTVPDLDTIMRQISHYAEAAATLHRYESERYRDDQKAALWRTHVERREGEIRAVLTVLVAGRSARLPTDRAADLDGPSVMTVLGHFGAPGLPASTWQTYLDQGREAVGSGNRTRLT